MAVSAHDIHTLLAELEQGDPLEFGEMPLDEDAARRLVVLSMTKFSQDLAGQGVDAEAREAFALATTARVLLDNLRLNYQLLSRSEQTPPDAQTLLKAISAKVQKP